MKGVRNAGRLKILSEEQVDAIHDASLRILDTTGIRYDSEDAIERLLKAGAERHPSRRNVLTFPRGIVEEAIRKIPRYGTYHARDPKNDLRF
ncbi:MAG TPA: trimethylamine methyltransferase family protein, partial [Thermoplasmata archaeon]|nr:trimethylamine methyltransferase family protein [Thermoplasmata archaeon]